MIRTRAPSHGSLAHAGIHPLDTRPPKCYKSRRHNAPTIEANVNASRRIVIALPPIATAVAVVPPVETTIDSRRFPCNAPRDYP